MESKFFDALLGYKSAMVQARVMLSQGLITPKELTIIETKMCEIHGVNFDSIYREIDLINTPYRVNMNAEKEVLQ